MEIKGFLRRPQTLQPKFNLDINVKEYIKQYRKYLYYRDYFFTRGHTNIIDNIYYNNNLHSYSYLFQKYEFPYDVVNPTKFDIIGIYNKLKNSEMYDTSICKMCALEINEKYYLAIHFPKLFLSVVNSNEEPIEIRDIYFYLNTDKLSAFRTTLDVTNPKFIHPHISGNFGSYCLGSSPLVMSLNILFYNLDSFTEDDADIFWVNFYRTITQKTEIGDHYYALSKLDESKDLEWDNFIKLIYNNEEFMSSLPQYVNIINLSEEILINVNTDAIIKDFFTLLSYDHNSLPNKKENLESIVKIDDVTIKTKKLTSIYKKSRKVYNNIEYLLNLFVKKLCPTSVINTIYDDYKEKFKQSNNSGEQSVGQNQVFEFQML